MYENDDVFDISQPQYKRLREVLEILPDLMIEPLKEALIHPEWWKNYNGHREAFIEDLNAAEDLKEMVVIIEDALRQVSPNRVKEPLHDEEGEMHIATIDFFNGFSLVEILSTWGLRRESNYMTRKRISGILNPMLHYKNGIESSLTDSSKRLNDSYAYYSIRNMHNEPEITFIVNSNDPSAAKEVYMYGPKFRALSAGDPSIELHRILIEKLKAHLGEKTHVTNFDLNKVNKPRFDLS